MSVFAEIEQVQREYYAARQAVAELRERSARDPTVIKSDSFSPRDVRGCLDNMEGTYIVRLFAVFESALRRYWRYVRRRDTKPYVSALMDSVGARQAVETTVASDAHRVREYRNVLVHLGSSAEQVSFEQARAYLAKFLGRLDHRWLKDVPPI